MEQVNKGIDGLKRRRKPVNLIEYQCSLSHTNSRYRRINNLIFLTAELFRIAPFSKKKVIIIHPNGIRKSISSLTNGKLQSNERYCFITNTLNFSLLGITSPSSRKIPHWPLAQ